MQGDVQVIEALNEVLTAELTAINQYFVHAKMCKNWGLDKIAKIVRALDQSTSQVTVPSVAMALAAEVSFKTRSTRFQFRR